MHAANVISSVVRLSDPCMRIKSRWNHEEVQRNNRASEKENVAAWETFKRPISQSYRDVSVRIHSTRAYCRGLFTLDTLDPVRLTFVCLHNRRQEPRGHPAACTGHWCRCTDSAWLADSAVGCRSREERGREGRGDDPSRQGLVSEESRR